MIEVPNFGSLRGSEREIVVLRSDNGETWREHTVELTDEIVKDILGANFEKEGIVVKTLYILFHPPVKEGEEGGELVQEIKPCFPHTFYALKFNSYNFNTFIRFK